MDIGNRILQLRKQKGVTQQQLAEYLSILPQTVSRWESGGGMPDIALLPKIAIFFGITLDELFGMRDIEQIFQLVMRYSVLRDEKSFTDAMNAVTAGEEQAREAHDNEKRKQLMAYRMHLLLQKSNQALKEADEIADALIGETEDASDPLHLTVRLQKMQFDIHNGNVVKCLNDSMQAFETAPDMEALQIYSRALLETGQGDKALALYENDFVSSVLAKNNADSVIVWDILFEAAAITDDLNFFDEHFAGYEKLKRQIDPDGNCIDVRRMLTEMYGRRGMKEEKERCRQELLKELESDKSLKKSELFYQTFYEKILKM